MTTTILVIEDDVNVRRAIEESLSYAGYHVELAADTFVGLDLVDKIKPSLIICDYVLPGLSGESFFIQSRRNNNIPFIMVSGFDKSNCLQGQDHYYFMAKPFDEGKLIKTVQTALENAEN